MISSPECPHNHLIYSIDIVLGSAIFFNESSKEHSKNIVLIMKIEIEGHVEITEVLPVQEKWWNLHFDGVVGKDGARAGFCINGPDYENFISSYKLYFDCTNNVSK